MLGSKVSWKTCSICPSLFEEFALTVAIEEGDLRFILVPPCFSVHVEHVIRSERVTEQVLVIEGPDCLVDGRTKGQGCALERRRDLFHVLKLVPQRTRQIGAEPENTTDGRVIVLYSLSFSPFEDRMHVSIGAPPLRWSLLLVWN